MDFNIKQQKNLMFNLRVALVTIEANDAEAKAGEDSAYWQTRKKVHINEYRETLQKMLAAFDGNAKAIGDITVGPEGKATTSY